MFLKLLMGRRKVGHYDYRLEQWRIRRPFRLFVEEQALMQAVVSLSSRGEARSLSATGSRRSEWRTTSMSLKEGGLWRTGPIRSCWNATGPTQSSIWRKPRTIRSDDPSQVRSCRAVGSGAA